MSLKDIKHYCALFTLAVATTSIPIVSAAETHVPYKIDMSRTSPDQPIRKSTIMGKVKDTYAGRILSIEPYPDRGADCHIVKQMGDNGEFRIIHVACNK